MVVNVSGQDDRETKWGYVWTKRCELVQGHLTLNVKDNGARKNQSFGDDRR